MSHFDDVAPIIWAGPGGVIGLIIGIIAIIWACNADHTSMKTCEEHGEKYIDSRTGYTLCEQDGGTVVRR